MMICIKPLLGGSLDLVQGLGFLKRFRIKEPPVGGFCDFLTSPLLSGFENFERFGTFYERTGKVV